MSAAEGIYAVKKGSVHVEKRDRSRLWIFVIIPVLVIPIENQYSLFGLSLGRLAIIPLLIGILLFWPHRLVAMWKHPIFLSGMGFLAWGALAEALHPFSSWGFLLSVFQMFVFASLVASVCVNPVVFRRVLVATVSVSLLLAFYLVFNFYGSLRVGVTGFQEASGLRAQTFEDMSLLENLNMLGYTVAMGAVVGLTKLLDARRIRTRVFWGALYILCALGTTIPLSRGALIALMAGTALVLWRFLGKVMRPGMIVLACGIIVLLVVLVPEALVARLSSFSGSEDVVTGKEDSRITILNLAVESLPEYWAFGVGAGQYWTNWGMEHGFGKNTLLGPATLGPHNGLFAAWIYYGLPGIVLLCLTCFLVARYTPWRRNPAWEAVALLGLLGIGFVWLIATHNLYLKEFGLMLGLLMGASRGALQQGVRLGQRGRQSQPVKAEL